MNQSALMNEPLKRTMPANVMSGGGRHRRLFNREEEMRTKIIRGYDKLDNEPRSLKRVDRRIERDGATK